MYKILVIALNTFREAIRNKILYVLLFFALVMLLGSLLLGEISFGHTVKITKDVGLTSISLFGILIAIFVGVNLVHKEIDKRTLYTVIAKPIHRYQFILGKYVGMLLTVFVQVLVMSLVFTFLLLYREEFLDWNVYSVLYLYWIEIMLIVGVALFFSSFTTPFFSGLFTFSLFVVGRLMPDLQMALKSLEVPALKLLLRLGTLLPDLQSLNISQKVVHKIPVPFEYFYASTVYALSYTVLFLLAAVLLFSRRDFV